MAHKAQLLLEEVASFESYSARAAAVQKSLRQLQDTIDKSVTLVKLPNGVDPTCLRLVEREIRIALLTQGLLRTEHTKENTGE